MSGQTQRTPFSSMRYVPFRNDSGYEIPAYGIVQVTGTVDRDGVRVLKVSRPTDVGKPDVYAINSAHPVPASAGSQYRYGICSFDLPHKILYDDSDTPAIGDTWGPQVDSFEARKGPVYFSVLSAGFSGVFLGARATPSAYVCKSTSGSDIAARSGDTPGSGTLTVYEFNSSGALVETELDITGYNLSASAVSGTSWLHTKQERRTGKHLIDFEDCG